MDGLGNAERFADYAQWEIWQKGQVAAAKSEERGVEKSRSAGAAGGSKKKLSYKETQELETMEERIAEAEKELQGGAGALEALTGFVFGEEALVNGLLSGVVDLVGNARKVGVDAGELKVVVDLVKQVAESRGIAVAVADLAGHGCGEFLLDGLFQDGSAHDGAGRVEAEEVAAGGFVEVAIGVGRAGCGDHALAQMSGTHDGGLDHLEELEGKGGAQQVVLLIVEGALDLLPGGRGCDLPRMLEAGE